MPRLWPTSLFTSLIFFGYPNHGLEADVERQRPVASDVAKYLEPDIIVVDIRNASNLERHLIKGHGTWPMSRIVMISTSEDLEAVAILRARGIARSKIIAKMVPLIGKRRYYVKP